MSKQALPESPAPTTKIRARKLAAISLFLCGLLTPPTVFASAGELPLGDRSCRPTLELTLASGDSIRAELFPEAGPLAFERLRRLASASSPGALSSVTLAQADPHGRVETSEIPALRDLPLEINPLGLGLDQQTIETAGQAMELLQQTLLPIHTRNKNASPTPLFGSWVEQWRAQHRPDFLVGVSMMEVYQALGLVYSDQVESRPVIRGSLMLTAASPRVAHPRLAFSLVDRPDQTGRWQVLGQVTSELDLLRELSTRDLVQPTAKRGRLAEPVAIVAISLSCP